MGSHGPEFTHFKNEKGSFRDFHAMWKLRGRDLRLELPFLRLRGVDA